MFRKVFSVSKRARSPRRPRARLAMLACVPMLALSGCLKHTRIMERPQAPTVVLTASAQQLIQALDQRYDAIHSMNATVLIQASVGGVSKGKVTDYTSVRGYILLRQPSMLRVLGLLPVIETRAFDMASNGKNFILLIPPKDEAVTGTGTVTTPSKNPLMNLRPAVFYDSMLVKKVGPDDLVYVTSDTGIVRDPHSHHLIAEPDYELGILRRSDDSQQLIPERVIHISRTDLLPFQQDEYDDHGILVTRTLYSDYHTFDQIPYPTKIQISRPIDGYQILLTIEKLTFNHPLADDQFELKIPPGTKIQKLP
ncbi:MAG: outer membrane lipoprotein-sorting protein [Acidobacteriaceae bacterium]